MVSKLDVYRKTPKQRRAQNLMNTTPDINIPVLTMEQKMIKSLENTVSSNVTLSRGQRKRMKKKHKFLRRALLEQKIEMEQKLINNKK